MPDWQGSWAGMVRRPGGRPSGCWAIGPTPTSASRRRAWPRSTFAGASRCATGRRCWSTWPLHVPSTGCGPTSGPGSRNPIDGLEQVRDAALSPIRQAEEAELADELRAALGQIPPRQAEVFCLHCLEDWSYQEIAEHLGISIDSVGVLLHRARNRLRLLLAKYQESCASTASDERAGCQVSPTGKPEKGALMTRGANLDPGSAGDDDRLARALAALRRTDVPDGPSAEVLARTLAAVEAAANTTRNVP